MARTRVLALDSSAVVLLSRGKPDVRAFVRKYTRSGAAIIVPAPVLAETLRGRSADANVHRVLNVVLGDVNKAAPLSARASRDAGERLGRTRSAASKTLDALIISCAHDHGATKILTQDVSDLQSLAGTDLVVVDARE